jgi:hypothetical protein
LFWRPPFSVPTGLPISLTDTITEP